MSAVWDADVIVFNKARELLLKKGIDHKGMEMVLFAMLMYGVSYSEALKMWSQFSRRSTRTVGRELDAVTRAAGQEGSARVLLNELYRKEVAIAYGVCATEGG